MGILVGSGITAVSEKTNRSKLFTFYLCSLPNDITGDISPEELRALAYDSAKQGLSIQQIVSLLLHWSGGIRS
jgi:predicted DNA binding CopG/RHH family protein